jgi:hypothetical protein
MAAAAIVKYLQGMTMMCKYKLAQFNVTFTCPPYEAEQGLNGFEKVLCALMGGKDRELELLQNGWGSNACDRAESGHS